MVPSGRLLSSRIRLTGSLFFNCWDLGSLDRSPYDAIQMTVTLLSGSASTAGQSIQPTSVYWLSTIARVWFTSFATQPVGHCYPDSIVLLLLLLLLRAFIERNIAQGPQIRCCCCYKIINTDLFGFTQFDNFFVKQWVLRHAIPLMGGGGTVLAMYYHS